MGPYAPIRTLDAVVVFDILDSRPEMNGAVIGKATIGLRELQDQKKIEKLLTVVLMRGDEEEDGGDTGRIREYAKLYVILHFQFSRVLPLRTKIYHLQDALRGIDKNLTKLRIGEGMVDD